MPQYAYKTLTFGIEFQFLLATLARFIKDPLPKLSSEKAAYLPLSNIWRYSDVRKQPNEDLDLEFETAGPVAQRIALKNRGVPAYPSLHRTQTSLADGKKRTNRFRAEECDLAGWRVKTDWTIEVSPGETTKWWKKNPSSVEHGYS